MEIRRGNRIYTRIGGGQEGDVWSIRRDDSEKEGYVVVKDLADKGSITRERKEKLESFYVNLCQTYGKDLFPPQRLVRQKFHDGLYDSTETYVLLQKRLKLADPPDIFDYQPDELSAAVKERLIQLVHDLKVSYALLQKTGTSSQRQLLDLYGKANLVLTQSGEVKYIDTGENWMDIGVDEDGSFTEGSSDDFSDEGDGEYALHNSITSKIALLEILSGVNENVLKIHPEEPAYRDLLAFCKRLADADQNFPRSFESDDLEELRNFLLNINQFYPEPDGWADGADD